MKIIYADMSIELAVEYLKLAHQFKRIVTIDDRHGYTSMFHLIESIDFMSSDSVFVTNNPAAVNRIKEVMVMETDGFMRFVNSFQIICIKASGFLLGYASMMTSGKLTEYSNIETMLLNGGFDN